MHHNYYHHHHHHLNNMDKVAADDDAADGGAAAAEVDANVLFAVAADAEDYYILLLHLFFSREKLIWNEIFFFLPSMNHEVEIEIVYKI